MSLRLQKELADIKARFGSLDALTADELEEIVDCCRRMDDPFGDASASLLDVPVAHLRGADFRRLTVGASIWLDEYADRWWGGDDSRYFWALVYALTHSGDPDAFLPLQTERAARAAILRTALRFAFSRRALERAVDAALGRTDAAPRRMPGEPRVKTEWFSILASLESASGVPLKEWLWGRSAAYTVKAYQEMRHLASMRGGSEGARMFDELDAAINALARAKKRIKDRLEAGKERGA